MEKIRVNEQEAVKVDQAKVEDYVARQALEIERLHKEGKSIEECLRLTAHMVPSSSVVGNRIEYIKSLTSIAAVRKAQHGANSKLSKSRGKPEAAARYRLEIQTAKDRLNELMAQVGQNENPLQAALEMGEEASGIVQMIIGDEEERIKPILETVKSAKKWTRKTLKSEINAQSTETPPEMVEKLLAVSTTVESIYEDRRKGGDQRVVTLNKKLSLLNKLGREARATKEANERLAKEQMGPRQEPKTEAVKTEPKTEAKKEETKKGDSKPSGFDKLAGKPQVKMSAKDK